MSKDYSDKSDQELWQLAKVADDSRAFAELHRRYSFKLYKLAVHKTGNDDVSEDLVQDLFVALWLNRANISIEKGLNLYLFSALKNRIISHFRKQTSQATVSLDELNMETLVSQSADLVHEWMQVQEVQALYDRELENLPEKSRHVFEMSRSGIPNKEIARELAITEKTVEFHISKCLRILRIKFGYVVNLLIVFCFLHLYLSVN